jgi:hypothetical protein
MVSLFMLASTILDPIETRLTDPWQPFIRCGAPCSVAQQRTVYFRRKKATHLQSGKCVEHRTLHLTPAGHRHIVLGKTTCPPHLPRRHTATITRTDDGIER